jgi:hypothetical protein
MCINAFMKLKLISQGITVQSNGRNFPCVLGEWVEFLIFFLNSLETKFLPHNTYKFSPYLTGNMSPQQRSTDWCCLGEKMLFIVRTERNTKIYFVGRMQNIFMLNQVVHIQPLAINTLISLKYGSHGKQWLPSVANQLIW